MKVASIMFTMLNFMPSIAMIPSIHTQPKAIGTKAITATLRLRNDIHRNRNTINEHTMPI